MNQIPALQRLESALVEAIDVDQQRVTTHHARTSRYPIASRHSIATTTTRPTSWWAPRRRRWLIASAVGLAACGLSIGVLPLGGGTNDPQQAPFLVDAARAEVQVSTENDRMQVRIGNPDVDERDLAAALAAAGVPASVTFVPASPSLVGDLTASEGGRDVTYQEEGSGTENDYVVLTLPAHPSEPFNLSIGRAAMPGEDYISAAITAEAPGEVLHCIPVEGQRVATARDLIGQAGITSLWRSPGNDDVDPADLDQNLRVTSVVPWAANEVIVFTDDGEPGRGFTAEYEESLRRGCPA
ncbi:hypothetical protein [Kineococcus sp. R86509]|uniref:hypothetical protein n=1 Tax=Kineococcus sp. R86509 TaxID=3093851 RepID=UPI0036D2BEB4